MKSLFEKNLELLRKKNTKLAYQIAHTDPSALEFCQTKHREINLKRTFENQTYYYHSSNNALKEAQEWFQKLNLADSTVLFVYGIGLGYYFEAAKEWLDHDEKRHLVFLEEDLGVLYRLFEIERGTAILKHPQVKIYTFSDVLEDNEIFNEIAWTYIYCPFTVSFLSLYQEVNPDGFSSLHHRLNHDAVQIRALVEEYLQYGVAFFRNFYPNLLELPKAYSGNGLFGQFKNVPAIICGAGPSLNKNLETLRTLSQQALIFAGSSALNALIPKGVIPHFAAAIDPNSAQLKRVEAAEGSNVPFFYRNRLFHDALKAIDGPRLYLCGTGGYEVAEWFENELGLEGDNLDEGHNVINFCLSIAHALGCNPIILVGVDLAFTDQQPYADGVATNLKLTPDDFKRGTDFESTPIIKQDIHGQSVETLWKWVTEAEWISDFAKEHPEISIINATEGGLGFKEVPNIPLQEVTLNSKEDFYKRVQQAIKEQKLPKTISKARIFELMLVMKESLEQCVKHLDALMQEMGNLKSDELETHKTHLIEMAIEDEIAYRYILDTFNMIFLRVNHRVIQELSNAPHKKKIDLHLRRLQFLKDVARVNIGFVNATGHNERH